MTRHDARKKLFQSLGACFLAFVMILTNVLGAVEVQAAGIKAPTIDPVSIGATKVSGKGLIRSGQRSSKNAVCNIIVTVKDADGNVKETKTFSIQPTEKDPKGSAWSVTLTNPVLEGYKVYVKQELVGKAKETSEEVSVEVKKLLADEYKGKLTMPTGEIWIEQYTANIVNDDEKAEAIDLLKKANPTIAKDIQSVEFKITGVDPNKVASYTVTYTDKSKTEEIQAPDLTVKQVTEYSRNANLNEITIVDNVIKGRLEGEGPFKDIKVQLILKVSEAVKDSYCDEGKCLVDKNTSNPVDAKVDSETGEFSYTIPNPDLKIDQIVGVTVKEKNKFLNCSKTTVIAPIPKKTDVKDPRKLTAEDKKAIDAAIRTAYTVGGVSKLPNGTGEWDGVPAVIQIDDSGNVKIFSGNDVKGDWDWNNGGIFVPEKMKMAQSS